MTRNSPISGDIPYIYIYIYIYIILYICILYLYIYIHNVLYFDRSIPWFLSMCLQCSGPITFLLVPLSSSPDFVGACWMLILTSHTKWAHKNRSSKMASWEILLKNHHFFQGNLGSANGFSLAMFDFQRVSDYQRVPLRIPRREILTRFRVIILGVRTEDPSVNFFSG